ncbi:olfactory receptor 6F1-like [Rhinophrynus dorsalis]
MGAFLAVTIFIVYILTITANLSIIALVKTEQSLHKPMYFFIAGLSFLEIWYPSVTVPKLLWTLLTREESISPSGCMIQFYFHFSFGAIENFYLAVMAYDRYVAICNPLRYLLIMSPKTCTNLLLGSWVCGFMVMVVPCFQISNLWFCRHNQIDHYYCDFAPLVTLSCSETSHVKMLVFAMACVVILGCFILIIVSYACISHTTMTIPTSQGRRKAFSTCAAHLIVVLLFYGTSIFMFVRPNPGDLLYTNKIISIFPSIVTPLLNPIIYTFRNQEVKRVAIRTVRRMREH